MKITNARIVLKDRVIENGTIEIENERIKGIREGIEKDSDIDVGGKYLAPGIVDLHTHGSRIFMGLHIHLLNLVLLVVCQQRLHHLMKSSLPS